MIMVSDGLGIGGGVLILIAFALNQRGLWQRDSFRYDLVNFVGATLLVTSAMTIPSYPFAVLNAVWAAVSLRDSITDLRHHRHRRHT